MMLSRRALLAGATAAVAVGGIAAPGRDASAQEARFFRIATGPTESGNFAIGSLVGNLVSSPPGARECSRGGSCGVPGLIAVTQTTSGGIANIEAIRAKQVESALTLSDISYWAVKGEGPFKRQGPMTNLRAIANLYRQVVHIVVRRDGKIGELRQLKGKAVALGEKDSGSAVTARLVLQGMGLADRDYKALFLTPAEAVESLRTGRIDAMCEFAGLPSPLITELALSTEIALLPVEGAAAERLIKSHSFFSEAVISSAMYPGIKETTSVRLGVLWVVTAETSDRLVYRLTQALWHTNNRRPLDMGHPWGRQLRAETALEGVPLDLHPGAVLYYTEAGLLKTP
jgi:TRAP transporter TAXI family solute receptor